MDNLKRGNVLSVDRKHSKAIGYQHFGVYAGNKKVIHFTSLNSDVSSDNRIIKTDFEHFLRGKTYFHVMGFPDQYGAVIGSRMAGISENDNIFSMALDIIADAKNFVRTTTYHCYTPKECYERALACINNTDYSLSSNNCEHFAIWCKTGVSMSTQIDELLNTGSGGIRILRSVDLLAKSNHSINRNFVEVYEVGYIKTSLVSESACFGLGYRLPPEMELIHHPKVKWAFYVDKSQMPENGVHRLNYSGSELRDIDGNKHRAKAGHTAVKRLVCIEKKSQW